MNKTPSHTVEFEIEAGYDLQTCPWTRATWRRNQAGEAFEREVLYWYENQQFTSTWSFNGTSAGTLYVGYDDGGVHFDGRLTHARVLINGNPVDFQEAPPTENNELVSRPTEPTMDWEQTLKALDARLRASGLTVVVKEASDKTEFVATFPQGRRPRAKPRVAS